MKRKIIPALIAQSQRELEDRFNKVKNYTSWFHIDVMDGKFVENKSNWFDFKLPKTHSYEIHLMVDDPLKWTKENYSKGDLIMANIERLNDPGQFIELLKSKNKKKGFAINPETEVSVVTSYLESIEQVNILCVSPGRYGTSFLHYPTRKIENLRGIFSKDIEADGSQNPDTISKTINAGANIIVVGSYIQNSPDVKSTMKQLKQIVKI